MCWKVKRKCKKHCVNYADCIDKDKGKKGKAYNCENYRNIPYMTNPVPMPPVKQPKPSFLTNRQWLESLTYEELSKKINELHDLSNSACPFQVLNGNLDTLCARNDFNCKNCIEKWLQAEHKD